jgi:hypothetical protein
MRRHIFLVTAATVLAGATQAQVPAAPLEPATAFESFLRVASMVGKPSAELVRIWPASLTSKSLPRRFRVTAAHTIEVEIGGTMLPSESDDRVRLALWDERVADTTTLRRRVGELMRQLERLVGPVEQCSDPIGPPAYLFVDQRVARTWRRGLAGHPTQLVWQVASGDYKAISITVTVGALAESAGAAYACDAKRP